MTFMPIPSISDKPFNFSNVVPRGVQELRVKYRNTFNNKTLNDAAKVLELRSIVRNYGTALLSEENKEMATKIFQFLILNFLLSYDHMADFLPFPDSLDAFEEMEMHEADARLYRFDRLMQHCSGRRIVAAWRRYRRRRVQARLLHILPRDSHLCILAYGDTRA